LAVNAVTANKRTKLSLNSNKNAAFALYLN